MILDYSDYIMPQYITKEGLKKLKEELENLKTVEIVRITKLIKEAAAFGDLKENSGYHDARNAKSFVLGRIEQLENAVNDAVIREKTQTDTIQLGSEIHILFGDSEENYIIVSSAEADILKNKISYQSPLGQQLLGKVRGETFDFAINDKKIKVKILEVK